MITLLYDNFQLVSMYINFLTITLKMEKKYFPVFLHLVGLGSSNIFIAFFFYSIIWPTHTMFAYPRFFQNNVVSHLRCIQLLLQLLYPELDKFTALNDNNHTRIVPQTVHMNGFFPINPAFVR